MNILIIAGLLIFLAITLWRREWGVYLIILLLPSYQIRFSLGVPFTFLEGMILTLALRELIYLVRGKKMRSAVQTLFHSPVLTMAVAAFLFAALVSIFTGPSMIKGAGIFKAYFFEAFLFYAIVILTIDTREKRRISIYFRGFSIFDPHQSAAILVGRERCVAPDHFAPQPSKRACPTFGAGVIVLGICP